METLAGTAASRLTPGVLWVHSGGAINKIFAVDTTGGSLADYSFDQTLQDAEDIAIGPGPGAGSHYLYVSDSGDAVSKRSEVLIARFTEPAIDIESSGVNARFPDQTYFIVKYPDGAHAANALMIDPISNDLFLITHGSPSGHVYRISQAALAAPNPTFTLVTALPIASASAADISPNGSHIAIRNNDIALDWLRDPTQTVADALAGTGHSVPLLSEVNGDSLAFAADGGGYYTIGQAQNPEIYFFKANTTAYSSGVSLGTVSDVNFIEISGAAASRKNPGLLWVHNDGKKDLVYAISTNGQVFATLQFATRTFDFEDIAIGPGPIPNVEYVYCGDIGDNSSFRSEIHIFRFAEPTIITPTDTITSAGETIITLQYPDGAHDAEGLMVDPLTSDLFIANKRLGGFDLYKATQDQLNSGDIVQLTRVLTGGFEIVSGADISPDGSRIVLRREDLAMIWHRAPKQSIEMALDADGEEIPVIGTPLEPNGEAITFAPDSRSYYTMSEGSQPAIYYFTPLAQPRIIASPTKVAGGWEITVAGCDDTIISLDSTSNFISWDRSISSKRVTSGAATFTVPALDRVQFFQARVNAP